MKHNIDLNDNCNLKFNGNGVEIQVSLNIPKPLVKYVSKNNLYKGNKFYVYSIKQQLLSKDITLKNIHEVSDILLNKAMINVRKYKMQYLKDNINLLEKKSNEFKQLKLEL